jgi:ribosomal 30S subunit maturation factor RimM
MTRDLVCVGALKGPHGVKGLVKAKITLENPDLLKTGGGFWVAATAEAVPMDAPLKVRRWQAAGQGLLALQIDGVDHMKAAEALPRGLMWVDASGWPRPKNAIWLRACVGLPVTHNADVLGHVTDTLDLPAGPAVLVADAAGVGRIVPLDPACASLEEGQIVVTELGAALLKI